MDYEIENQCKEVKDENNMSGTVAFQYNIDLCHMIQWNLSATTTSIINRITLIYSVMCFNEDWRYQFALASDVCLL